MLVMANSKMSGNGLDSANDPLSPTTIILYACLSALTIALTYLIIEEFVPPHSPLSVVKGTNKNFLAEKFCFFLCKYV